MALQNRKFELSPRLKFGVGRGYSQNQLFKITAIICLIIALGLSVNAFMLIFSKDSSITQGNNQPQVLGANDIKTEETMQFINYTVTKGDTLFNISQKFDISWTTLATLNNLKSPFYLKLGQVIKVPTQ